MSSQQAVEKPIAEAKAKLASAIDIAQEALKTAMGEGGTGGNLADILAKIARELNSVVSALQGTSDEDYMPAQEKARMAEQLKMLTAKIAEQEKKDVAVKVAQYFPDPTKKMEELMKQDMPILTAQLQILGSYSKEYAGNGVRTAQRGPQKMNVSDAAKAAEPRRMAYL